MIKNQLFNCKIVWISFISLNINKLAILAPNKSNKD